MPTFKQKALEALKKTVVDNNRIDTIKQLIENKAIKSCIARIEAIEEEKEVDKDYCDFKNVVEKFYNKSIVNYNNNMRELERRCGLWIDEPPLVEDEGKKYYRNLHELHTAYLNWENIDERLLALLDEYKNIY